MPKLLIETGASIRSWIFFNAPSLIFFCEGIHKNSLPEVRAHKPPNLVKRTANSVRHISTFWWPNVSFNCLNSLILIPTAWNCSFAAIFSDSKCPMWARLYSPVTKSCCAWKRILFSRCWMFVCIVLNDDVNWWTSWKLRLSCTSPS